MGNLCCKPVAIATSMINFGGKKYVFSLFLIAFRILNLAVVTVLITCYCVTLIVVIQKLDVTPINLKKIYEMM